MSTFEPYVKRPVRFIRQLDAYDWRLKVYGLSVVSDELIDTVIQAIPGYLPSPAVNRHRYGVGFLIIHRSTLRNWFLLDWWEHGDILFHKLFSSPWDEPKSISAEQEMPALACVHELRVIDFESKAWIKALLRENPQPSLAEYMNYRFDNDAEA
ncbi:hypothetical protein ACS8Y6_13120 [Salinisphaera sp. RV14]|uniref:hypothetical protein n=1 Tax=unclassified Salinisphaera TaxID=2649847 RepID=UPI003F86A82E